MGQVIREIFSLSRQYKVQIIKRKDGLFSTEVCMFEEEYKAQNWSPIKQGLTLIDSEERSIIIALEQLREYSEEEL